MLPDLACQLAQSAASDRVLAYIRDARRTRKDQHCLIVGICGSQGSGKSTLSATVAQELEADGHTVAVLSLDDLYLRREARERLARAVHPLLSTRGVPGTHDIALGEHVLDSLALGLCTALPRFDKVRDEPQPQTLWPVVDRRADIVLFEGWCVGARPEEPEALIAPINGLERDSDSDGCWRRFVNGTLADDYQRIFERLDHLILLAAPSFDVVAGWRQQQERDLRDDPRVRARGVQHVMNDEGVERFVRHFERLTRHILIEMPGRADLTLLLGEDREVRTVLFGGGNAADEDIGAGPDAR